MGNVVGAVVGDGNLASGEEEEEAAMFNIPFAGPVAGDNIVSFECISCFKADQTDGFTLPCTCRLFYCAPCFKVYFEGRGKGWCVSCGSFFDVSKCQKIFEQDQKSLFERVKGVFIANGATAAELEAERSRCRQLQSKVEEMSRDLRCKNFMVAKLQGHLQVYRTQREESLPLNASDYQDAFEEVRQLSGIEIAKKENRGPVLGIDLGTTHCCAAFIENGSVHFTLNERNKSFFKSILRLCHHAQARGPYCEKTKSLNIASCVKRFLCSDYNEAVCQSQKLMCGLAFKRDNENRPVVCVPCQKDEIYSVTDLYAIFMDIMKRDGEACLNGHPITDAVIVVPEAFSQNQRKTVVDVAHLVRFKNVLLVNETVAALQLYLSEQQGGKLPETALVLSMGGGFCEASYWEQHVDGRYFMSNCCSIPFGGEDIDSVLVRHCLSEWAADLERILGKLTLNSRQLMLLKEKCQKAKEELSSNVKQSEITFNIAHLGQKSLLISVLSKKTFEQYIMSLVWPQLKSMISQALAGRSPQRLIITGGSMKVDCLMASLTNQFRDIPICNIGNYLHAIANGAALCTRISFSDEFVNAATLTINCYLEHVTHKDKKAWFCIRFCGRVPYRGVFHYPWPEALRIDDAHNFNFMVAQNGAVFGKARMGRSGKAGLPLEIVADIDENGIIRSMAVGFEAHLPSLAPLAIFDIGLTEQRRQQVMLKLYEDKKKTISLGSAEK